MNGKKALKDLMDTMPIALLETNAIRYLEIIEKELDAYYELQEEHKELEDDYEALSKKYSMFDYWRKDALKYGKICDILKQSPFILEVMRDKTKSEEYKKRYEFGTITDEEVNIIKDWFEL